MNHISRFVGHLAGKTCPDLLRPELLSDIFLGSVDACPDRTALICGGERMSYAELNAQAQHVAELLWSRGIGAGHFVGLWQERSAKTLVSLLGIVKSGATYIPFDADAPAQRVLDCLTDSNAAAILVDDVTAIAAQNFPMPLLKAGDRATKKPTSAPAPATPDSLAYAIYTSGSTGKPKAVGITHRNICQYLRAANQVYGLTADDVVFQGASVAFDLSLEEIFLPLMMGATLWVATRDTMASTDRMSEILTEAGITVLDTVPTLLALLNHEVPSLRVIILGGEVCPPSLADRWSRHGRRIFNSYGPTETTVVATVAEIVPGQPVTIGGPIPNSTCYVVDDQLQQVPAGTEGELLIGGPGVAPGYLGRPDLTAEKFIANPFTQDGLDPVLYRTGDAVLIDETGQLVFKGRIDDQVKVRGFRIELGEIEARLAALPAISQAAVVLRRQDETDFLAAFLVAHPGQDIDVGEIRSALARQMPAYMVPSRFQTIDVLPRLISGKVDRKALAALPLDAGDAPGCETPTTETEAILLEAAKRVFPGQPIGFDEDFFLVLGGHSLIAAHFVSHVRQTPHLAHITLQDIYSGRTLRAVAQKLDAGLSRHHARPSQSFAPPPVARRLICAAAQALVLPIILALATAPWLGVFVSYMLLSGDDADFLTEVAYLLTTYSIVSLSTMAIAVAAKWLVIGRTKPGRYPLWGVYYFRWWLAQRFLGLIHTKWFQDSPLIRIYLRLLGAKVGSGSIIGEVESGAFDLVSIGANCTIGGRVRLTTAEVIGNELIIGTLTIGETVSIGTSSALGRGCVIEDGAELDNLTALSPGTHVKPAEHWHGSPGTCVGHIDTSTRPAAARASLKRKIVLGLAHAVAMAVLPPMTLIPIFPAFHLMDRLTDWVGGNYLYYLPLAAWPTSMVMIAVTVGLIVAFRWIVLPSVKAGTYSVYSGFYFRKWVVALCTELTLDTLSSLYATVYMRFWYRLMGTTIGNDAEISTNLCGRYDLTEIGDKCFIADDVMLGEEECQMGWVTLEPVTIGARVFVGNDAVVPAGSVIPSDTLIGIKSATPPNDLMTDGPSIWFGSGPTRFPVRQEFKDIGANWTYDPPPWKRIARAVFEAFSVSFPTMLFISFGTYAVEALAPAILDRDLSRVIPQFILASTLVSIALMLSAVGMKWLMMGVYRPTVKPMWSWWALRSEAIAVLYWGLAGKVMLDHLRGSPFLPMCMRLFGAKIGKGVFMDTTDITEFDCITVGDWCAINTESSLQTHLYEDRVMKIGRVTLGQGITIGGSATVLYDTHVGDFARIGPLSIIMKGETIPAHSSWHGAPAQTMSEADMAASAPANAFIGVENLSAPAAQPAYKQAS